MNSQTTKKLLKIVLLTLVVSYAIDKLVFFGLNAISDKVMTGQAIGKLNHFLSVKDSTDVLVFGNSRANHHIDMSLYSDNGFNMGVDGTGIAYSSTLINTLLKDKKQLVIVHVDTKNFFDESYEGADIRGLKTKFKRDKNITEALKKSGQLSTLQNFYYSMNYNGNAVGILKNFFKPNYDYKTYNGYDPLSVSKSQESMRDIVLSKTDEKNCLENYTVNTTAKAYLEAIKTYTENSNKTFVFVTSPAYSDTCSGDNAKLNSIMRELGLTYKDYTNLYKTEKDNSYWKDKTHMSKKGAEAFSKYLLNELKHLR